ncbi:MAG: hypothetical protein K6G83_07480, partial [Lachnospiraceae bacterium]|nr:hypothetical protein [Lachnospiraceae bacterium]
MKKFLMGICGLAMTGLFVCGLFTEVKAALPCTYDIINDANSQIAAATAAYEKAKAAEAEALAYFNSVKNDPAHSQLEYDMAAL